MHVSTYTQPDLATDTARRLEALGLLTTKEPMTTEDPFDGLSVLGQRSPAGVELAVAEAEDACPACRLPMAATAGPGCVLADEHEIEVVPPWAGPPEVLRRRYDPPTDEIAARLHFARTMAEIDDA